MYVLAALGLKAKIDFGNNMIAGIFHAGSGCGDQLFRYITVRTLAEEKGYEWAMFNTNNFKGDFFLDKPKNAGTVDNYHSMMISSKIKAQHFSFLEKVVRDENGVDIRSYDPEINFVEDNTIIDGSFEDSKYWHHNLENINKWLAVEPLEVPDDLCVIGFRGGEYASNPDLFLTPEYYGKAMQQMPAFVERYEIHTDDAELAKTFFKGSIFTIIENQAISHSKHTNMALNWRSMRYAKYAIIPNSAFFIIPRLLKHLEDPTAVTVAPRFWARRNTKTWARPACYYKEFFYV